MILFLCCRRTNREARVELVWTCHKIAGQKDIRWSWKEGIRNFIDTHNLEEEHIFDREVWRRGKGTRYRMSSLTGCLHIVGCVFILNPFFCVRGRAFGMLRGDIKAELTQLQDWKINWLIQHRAISEWTWDVLTT